MDDKHQSFDGLDRSRLGGAILPLLLAALTAYWGYVTLRRPVSSPRPADESDTQWALIGAQQVPARLWQDPFEVTRSTANGESNRTAPEKLQDHIVNIASTNVIHVVAVMLEGYAYPEDKEIRRRLRYAMQQALEAAQFRAEDRNHLGLLTVPWESSGTNFGSNYLHLLGCVVEPDWVHTKLQVPFEWFTSEGHKPPVLVLWLPEEQFVDFPLPRLLLLLDRVFLQKQKFIGRFDVIGPRSSNTLRAFADTNYTSYVVNQLGDLAPKLRFYSCQATVPDSLLLGNRAITLDGVASRATLSTRFQNAFSPNDSTTPVLHNGITADDALATLLVQELGNRGVRLNKQAVHEERNHVLLLHESDTMYGRSLATLVRGALQNANNGLPLTQTVDVLTNAAHVHVIPFLRGLDGTKSGAAAELAEQGTSTSKRLFKFESAEGDHQVDYIRRLTEHSTIIANRSRIRAIGLLGSDAYDKLMLLQVLRRQFPEAVFFTTDLDGRLLHQDEQTWTRNLVVASAFGLEIPDRPGLVFRDSYQTAMYYAAFAAISNHDTNPPAPKLYEIGRNYAIALEAPRTNCTPNWKTSIHEDIRQWMPSGGIACWIAALSGASLLLLLRNVARTFYLLLGLKHAPLPTASELNAGSLMSKAELDRQIAAKAVLIIAAFCVSAAIVSLCVEIWKQVSMHPGEEPFVWFEGVSAWPTEVVRAITISFSLVAIVWAYWTFRTRLHSVFPEYKLNLRPISSKDVPGFRLLFQRIRARERRVSNSRVFLAAMRAWHHYRSITLWPKPTDAVDARTLLFSYQQRGTLVARFFRVALLTSAFLVCGLSLMAISGFPVAPVRGEKSSLIDVTLLSFTIFLFVLLLAYVVDVTRLTERLISRLGDGETIWPEELVDERHKKTGIPKTLLSGVLDVEFVAQHTRHVNIASFFPFIALSLLLAARSAYFDRWPWPWGLKAALVVYFIITSGCAWSIRRSARRVRDEALKVLHRYRAAAPSAAPADHVELALAYIHNHRIGAYAGWWQDPAIAGSLIAPGGAGAVSILRALVGG